jgi:hypothetical protein
MYGGRTQDTTRKYADNASWPYAKLVMQRVEEISQATIPVFITVSCLTDSQHVRGFEVRPAWTRDASPI